MPTVLIVEDEPVVGRVLCEYVDRAMPGVITCAHRTNGADAMGFLLAHEGVDVRLVIVDLHLPDIGGRDLIRQILAQRPELKGRLVVSTGELLSDEDPFFAEFDCGRLDKPVDLEELRGLIVGAVTSG